MEFCKQWRRSGVRVRGSAGDGTGEDRAGAVARNDCEPWVFKKPVEIYMQAINFKEIQVLGARVYRREDFEMAVELAMRLPLQQIVTQTFALHEVAEAFQKFRADEDCKALILPQRNA